VPSTGPGKNKGKVFSSFQKSSYLVSFYHIHLNPCNEPSNFFLAVLTVNSGEAIDSLLSITSADVSQIRLMMDALLRIYLGKLILLCSS